MSQTTHTPPHTPPVPSTVPTRNLRVIDTTPDAAPDTVPDTVPEGADVIDITQMRKTKIRPASLSDTLAIHDTLLDALEAADTPFPAPELPYALQALMDKIAQGLVCVAVDPTDTVVGTIVLDTAHWPWTSPSSAKGLHLYNQHYWVEPAYRKGGAGIKLLEWAKTRSDELKLPLLIELSSLESNTELKDQFVKSRGFRYIGGKFFRTPNQS